MGRRKPWSAAATPWRSKPAKGLFCRQEIQNLIALTRFPADRRETMVFRARLRGAWTIVPGKTF